MLRLLCTTAAISIAVAGAASAQTQATPEADVILDSRLRFEFVDQDGLPEQARAFTLRTRAGFETPELAGFKVLLEVEDLRPIVEDYNDGLNGKARYPLVGDPEGTELNRAQLTWSGPGDTTAVLGRQRIVLNNARFIGNAGWRQREQTFDAVRLDTEAFGPMTLSYIYLDRVLRTAGRDSPVGEYDSDSHLLQGEAETPWGQAVAYGYLVDLKNAPALSSATWGGRLTGSRPAGKDLALTYAAEYARQSDYGSQPRSFDLDYLLVEGGLKAKVWAATATVERLDGDGRVGVITALGSSHSFQGWSDAIVSAPPEGLLDLTLRASAEWKGAPVGEGLKFSFGADRFTDADNDRAFGREIDASVSTRLTKHLTAEIKAAVFDGEVPAYADRTKIWATTELKF